MPAVIDLLFLSSAALTESAPAELWSWTSLVSLLTLTALEIVLGIDNVIFIAILSGKLPKEKRAKAQQLGIGAAVLSRIILLFFVAWLMKLTEPLWPGAVAWFNLNEISGKGLILIVGGLFLLGKAVFELHEKLEAAEGHGEGAKAVAASVTGVIVQIMLIDLVFSLDSVITAVGVSGQLPVMVTAVLAAAVVMIVFAKTISQFVERHPTLKVLALAFLMLIGFMLFAEGFGYHVPKGYIYFAMTFSLGVELFNMALRRKKKKDKVKLHHSKLPDAADS